MGLFNIRTLLLTSATLLNSIIELKSQANFIIPAPYPDHRPPSYQIVNNRVLLTGESVGSLSVIVGDYFLGTIENNQLRQVDPHNRNAIIRISSGRFVEVTNEFRIHLENWFSTDREIHSIQENDRPGGHGAAGSSHQGGRGG